MATEDPLEKAKEIARKYGVALEVRSRHNPDRIDVKISYKNLKDINGFLNELSETPGVGYQIFYWSKSNPSKTDKYVA